MGGEDGAVVSRLSAVSAPALSQHLTQIILDLNGKLEQWFSSLGLSGDMPQNVLCIYNLH